MTSNRQRKKKKEERKLIDNIASISLLVALVKKKNKIAIYDRDDIKCLT